jgi:hypothetical protein
MVLLLLLLLRGVVGVVRGRRRLVGALSRGIVVAAAAGA